MLPGQFTVLIIGLSDPPNPFIFVASFISSDV